MERTVLIPITFLLLVVRAVHSGSNYCSKVMEDPNHTVCPLFPESTEGPYYVDGQAVRQNITEGKSGVPLEITMKVFNYTTCEPLVNVAVDIWHCDALGEYSSFVGITMGPPPSGQPPTGPPPTGQEFPQPLDDNTFLRGVQFTDNNGTVTFYTIFPDWYQGRTVHIHVDVHAHDQKHTGQLYFVETLTAEIAALEPYAQSTITRLTNAQDGIFTGSDGLATSLNLDSVGNGYKTSILMGFE